MLGLQFSFIDYISPIIVTTGIPGKFQVISTLSELLMNHAYSCLACAITLKLSGNLEWSLYGLTGRGLESCCKDLGSPLVYLFQRSQP